MQCLLFSIFHVIFFCSIVRKLITWAKCETLTVLAKTSRKTDKYFPFAKSNLCESFFTNLRHFLTFLLFVFILKITWHLGKVNKKGKTERVSNLIEAQLSCFGFTSFKVPHVYSLKQPIIIVVEFVPFYLWYSKNVCFIEALCTPLLMEYAHCKPFFPFQDNA